MSDKDVCLNFPTEMHCVLPHLRGCNMYTRPDYRFDNLKLIRLFSDKPKDLLYLSSTILFSNIT